MWVWEVVNEVEPIALFYYQTLGSYFYIMLILPCYARRRGLGLRVSMTDVSLLTNGSTKVATLIHIWVDCLWAPGESIVVLGYPGVPV